MTYAIATKPRTEHSIVSPTLGAFTIQATGKDVVQVFSYQTLLVGNLLYRFAGDMSRVETGYRFVAESVQAPKLSPKKREEMLEELTRLVNEYLAQHPEIEAAFEREAWVRDADGVAYDLRRAYARVVNRQDQIERLQREAQEDLQLISELTAQLQQRLENVPEDVEIKDEWTQALRGKGTGT